ncbi:tyrosine-type recombinase/integrase [Salimicrobium flavidum]|nr:tyrosine-type recombinase/integrase [Salimicrobium flavidum]
MRRTTVHAELGNTALNLTLPEALEYVYAFKQSEGLRPETMKDYPLLWRYFTEYLAEHEPDVERVEDITTQIIRKYVGYLQNEHYNEKRQAYGLAPATINIRLRILRSIFNVLHSENIVNKNPMVGVKLLKTDEDKFTPFTKDELHRLLKQPDVKYYASFRDLVAMYLMLDTGIRAREIFNLEMRHVDFKMRCLTLTGDITKNRKPRILPLSNEVIRLLMELVSEVKANFATEYVFTSSRGERYRANSFRKRLYNYRISAGIEKPVSPHSLRHQFCTDYILNGGDLFTLQRIAGHENITTTRKYIQFTSEDIKRKHAEFSPVVALRKKYRR